MRTKLRLDRLERDLSALGVSTAPPCKCESGWFGQGWVDLDLATAAEFARVCALLEQAELPVAQVCPGCGKRTLREDRSLLSPDDRAELESLLATIREREAVTLRHHAALPDGNESTPLRQPSIPGGRP